MNTGGEQPHRGIFDLLHTPPKTSERGPTAEDLRACLGPDPERSDLELSWGSDGEREAVRIRELSWNTGLGNRTEALFLTPAQGQGPWPATLALHDHGGFRWLGKEKIADGVRGPHPDLGAPEIRRASYDGLAFANRLARRGHAVLVHDVFSWGSRRFRWDALEERFWLPNAHLDPEREATSTSISAYNHAANAREGALAKWFTITGHSLAGILAWEDSIALDILEHLPDVDSLGPACMGFSGGAARSFILGALRPDLRAVAGTCLMSTYAEVLRHRTWLHSWQMIPPGWPRIADWPDVAALALPKPLLVQYGSRDEGFTTKGMEDAHQHLTHLDHRQAYTARFHNVGHCFNRELQDEAFSWLEDLT